MPQEGFYRGLTLTQQLQKFLNHHFDREHRHISAYEAALIQRAIDCIEGSDSADSAAPAR